MVYNCKPDRFPCESTAACSPTWRSGDEMFRKILYTVWYLWNWKKLGRVLLIFFGGLFFLSGAACYASRETLPETPLSVDLQQVVDLVRQPAPRYVSFVTSD